MFILYKLNIYSKMLELKTIQRMSMQNICVMLNLNYEKAKQLKKKDIIYMINNNMNVDEMIAYKHKQVLEQLEQLKPKEVKLSDEEIKRIRKEYFQSDKGKLALKKAQKKYHEKKKLKLLSEVTL